MRRLIGVFVAAVLIGGACWFFGLGIVSAIVVALVIGAGGAVWRVLPAPGPDREWPPGPAATLDGARRETSQLSWSLRTRGGTIDPARVVARVRTIAVNRLALRQLDLDDPAHRRAIERLIGSPAYELITADLTRPVHLSRIANALDALNALERVQGPHATPIIDAKNIDPAPER
jgi:hypothetical protein